jgi:hypothetical protein
LAVVTNVKPVEAVWVGRQLFGACPPLWREGVDPAQIVDKTPHAVKLWAAALREAAGRGIYLLLLKSCADFRRDYTDWHLEVPLPELRRRRGFRLSGEYQLDPDRRIAVAAATWPHALEALDHAEDGYPGNGDDRSVDHLRKDIQTLRRYWRRPGTMKAQAVAAYHAECDEVEAKSPESADAIGVGESRLDCIIDCGGLGRVEGDEYRRAERELLEANDLGVDGPSLSLVLEQVAHNRKAAAKL